MAEPFEIMYSRPRQNISKITRMFEKWKKTKFIYNTYSKTIF